jgi:hypothetical protein
MMFTSTNTCEISIHHSLKSLHVYLNNARCDESERQTSVNLIVSMGLYGGYPWTTEECFLNMKYRFNGHFKGHLLLLILVNICHQSVISFHGYYHFAEYISLLIRNCEVWSSLWSVVDQQVVQLLDGLLRWFKWLPSYCLKSISEYSLLQ